MIQYYIHWFVDMNIVLQFKHKKNGKKDLFWNRVKAFLPKPILTKLVDIL